MLDKPFPSYQGTQPYVFVCYAHANSDVVYPEIAWLDDYHRLVWEKLSPHLSESDSDWLREATAPLT